MRLVRSAIDFPVSMAVAVLLYFLQIGTTVDGKTEDLLRRHITLGPLHFCLA